MIEKRLELAYDTVQKKSSAIVSHLKTIQMIRQSDCLFMYNGFNHEVDLHTMVELGIPIALPQVIGKTMVFRRIVDETTFATSRFGVEEPIDGVIIRPSRQSILLLPGSCFDKQGHRIGYGGGFYDRYLAQNHYRAAIAVAYNFQLLDAIPFESHDVMVNGIVTESGYIAFNQVSD